MEELTSLFREAADFAGATFLKFCDVKFEPQGSSGAILLSESHYAFHTWPERFSLVATFYTCGNIDSEKALRFVAERIGARSVWGSVTDYDTRQIGEVNIQM